MQKNEHKRTCRCAKIVKKSRHDVRISVKKWRVNEQKIKHKDSVKDRFKDDVQTGNGNCVMD